MTRGKCYAIHTELQQYGFYTNVLSEWDVNDQLTFQQISHKVRERAEASPDLVIDIRIRIFLCGLALVPWLYRFLCILWYREIQPVYASSSDINPGERDDVTDRLTSVCLSLRKGCLYCCPLSGTHSSLVLVP